MQTFQDFEVLVIDDGGTDNSAEITKSFNDPRITYYYQENAERGAARNYGALLAKGNYVNFFDSDDIAYANHLQTAYDFILLNPRVETFHTSYDWLDVTGKKIKPAYICRGSLNEQIFRSNVLSCNNVFIKKEIFQHTFFCEDRELSGSEDWHLWIRLACKFPVIGVPIVTSAIIQHDARSMTTASGHSTLKRALAFERNLQEIDKFPGIKNRALAEFYSLTSLYFVLDRDKGNCVKYFKEAVGYSFSILFTKRAAAILIRLLR